MKKLICKIFGHKMRNMVSGSLIIYCKRCGELSDFTKWVEKKFESGELT